MKKQAAVFVCLAQLVKRGFLGHIRFVKQMWRRSVNEDRI